MIFKPLRLSFLFCLILPSISPLFAGGPWPPGKGLGFFQLGAYGIPPTQRLFNQSGKIQLLNRKVLDLSFQAYGEYGLGEKLWITAALPLKYVGTGAALSQGVGSQELAPADSLLAQGQVWGLGNVEISAKYNIYAKMLNISVGMGISAPTGSYQEATALRTGFPVWGLMPQIALGMGFSQAYFLLEGGFNYRVDMRKNPIEKYSHEALANFEFGYRLGKSHFIALFLNGRFSMRNQAETDEVQTGLYVNNQSYFAWGLKGIAAFTPQSGMTFSFAGAFAGHRVQAMPALGLGFYYKLLRKDPFN